MPETITVGDLTFTVLFPDLFRPLTDSERTDLKASIEARGVVVPVVTDDDAGLIDGIHRLTIAAELEMESVPVDVREGLTLAQKRELAETLNAHRRQMTVEEMSERRSARVERVVEARREGKSTRQIASDEGVSQPQVLRDLNVGTDTGVSVEPKDGKVKSKDGKERPARSTRKPKAEDTSAETPAEAVSEAPQQPDGKPGHVKFDDRVMTDLIGKITRSANERSKIHGKTPAFKTFWDRLSSVLEAWGVWQNEGER